MAQANRPTVTLVQGLDPAANKEAFELLESNCGFAVEAVRSFRAINQWMETPRVITREGYVVSGLESIRQLAGRLNGK
jgi:hypothetical protein